MNALEGKVVIITGAGRMRSIGRSTAMAMARKGADVVITGTGRHPSTFPSDEKAAGWRDIESVKEEVEALGRRCLALTVDVTKAQQVQDMVDRTLAEFGRIDFLVNNAAFARGADRVPVVDLSEDVWHRVLEIKLTGVFLCSQAVARVLLRQGQGGSIIRISSGAGNEGPPTPLLTQRPTVAFSYSPCLWLGNWDPTALQSTAFVPASSPRPAMTSRADRTARSGSVLSRPSP